MLLGGIIGSALFYLTDSRIRDRDRWLEKKEGNLVVTTNKIGNTVADSLLSKKRRKQLAKQMNLSRRNAIKISGAKVTRMGNRIVRLGKKIQG